MQLPVAEVLLFVVGSSRSTCKISVVKILLQQCALELAMPAHRIRERTFKQIVIFY